MTRRKLAGAALAGVTTSMLRADSGSVGETSTSERRELKDPTTGRRLIQLTSGDCFDMPMYFFIPTMSRDGKSIVFYRYFHRTGEIQLYRVHMESGVTVRLTNAKTPDSLWRPYLQPPGFGVRDLMCAVNAATNEAVYFDSNQIRAVHLDTLKDRVIAEVPEDRTPCSLTGISPNGKLFVFAHADRKWWESYLARRAKPVKTEARDVRMDVLDLETGRIRNVLYVNYWITHANFYDDHRILFCHSATDNAILLTDLRREHHYESIRVRSSSATLPCHYHATSKGIAYEMLSTGRVPPLAGLYNPDTGERRERPMALHGGWLHIGRDPEARVWFWETYLSGKLGLVYFPKLAPGIVNKPVMLSAGAFTPFSEGQRSHCHPSLTPDRKWILFTGGDARNQTNHLFLLHAADLGDTHFA